MMAKYIDANKLFRYVDEQTHLSKGKLQNYIRENNTSDVFEEVHGQWIKTDSFDNFKTPIYQCSVCAREVADNYIHLHKYCLHCGAKMDGRRDT